MIITKNLKKINQKDNYYQLITNDVEIRIWFLTDEIVRIRAGFDNNFSEESYTLMMTGWDDRLDHLYKNERKKIEVANSRLLENEKNYIIKGNKLKVEIQKSPFIIKVYDEEGTKLHADIEDLAYIKDNNNRRIHTSEITTDDYFYGFGEKTGEFNKAETFMSMSPKDAMGYNPKKTDSLYKHIPFYIKLNESSKKAVGYFYHNTYACDFDMGREHSNYWNKHSRYRTDGGDIDLFLISGPDISDVITRYTDLTGKSALLPRYSLGYLGSSMYYAELEENADEAILKFIDTAVKENIPIDGFQLSSGYSNLKIENSYRRSVFNWNYKRFKNPEGFFAEMNKRGVTVSPNIKPAVLMDNPLIEDMKEKNIFIKDPKTNQPGIGTWWGGKGIYADFTNPSTRYHWKEYLKEHILEKGTTSVWNDNCEYDGLIDDDYEVEYDGNKSSIAKARPIMSNLMCHVTEEAIKETSPNIRPFIVCRSGHSGIQRYAQTWAGDNFTSWDSLKYNIATILGMSISGVSNYGTDIGGFYGESPDEELFIRWVQHGIFQPRFSIHSTNTDNTVTEPWMFSKSKELIRDAIQFRYQLSPLLYSLMVKSKMDGLPILQPLVNVFQSDTNVYNEGINFMIGQSLLIANVVEQGQTHREIYFPKTDSFYDFTSREKFNGGQTINYPVEIDTIPLFIKSGSIVPIALNKITSLKNDKLEELKLICVPDKDGEFNLFEDDGLTENYREGEYLKTNINMTAGEKTLIKFTKTGKYDSAIKQMYLDIINHDRSPFAITVDNSHVPRQSSRDEFEKSDYGWYYSQTLKSVQLKYPNIPNDYEIEIDFAEKDLLGM